MEFIKSWKFMAIILGALALSAGIILIVAITTHSEPGLIEGVPRWSKTDFPLNVCEAHYDPGAGLQSERRASLYYVIDKVNERLGFPVLQAVDGDCVVTISFNAPAPEADWDSPGGDSELTHVGERATGCRVATSNVQGELLSLTLEHELGHCLGLAHDDFEKSIMRPVQSRTPDRILPPWISDYDRALLRGMYAP